MRFLASFILLFSATLMFGMPAYPRLIFVHTNGIKTPVYLYGDEKHKRMETIDGYTIRQNSAGTWCYAQKEQDGSLQPSKWSITEDKKSPELADFLKKTRKHIEASHAESRLLDSARTPSHHTAPAIGPRRVMVILMSFQDTRFSKTKEEFHDLFNKRGYKDDGAYGSVADFYHDASYGQLQLHSDIFGPYVATKNMKHYGGNGKLGGDNAPEELFKEAIAHVYEEVDDWSTYDSDHNGFIDNVHLIFAGYGEEAGANEDAIWSHELTFPHYYEYKEARFDRYSCAPELRGNSGKGISRIGPHCHEIGHALGAMDFYDTDYSTGGNFEGTGQWDVMASGSWNDDGIKPADFNPYVKAFNYGWVTPHALQEGQNVVLPSVSSADDYYILQSADHDDYYLIENRTHEKWGEALPGEGLLIYHIHKDLANAGNEINAKAPQKCYIVCASSKSTRPGSTPSSYGAINTAGCPYPGTSENRNFGRSSVPQAFYWGGETCDIELKDITAEPDGKIRLNYSSHEDETPESKDYEQIFFEDFESEMKVSILEESLPMWCQTSDSPDPANLKEQINAYEGKKCLQLSAKKSATEVSSTAILNLQKHNRKEGLAVSLYALNHHSGKKTQNSTLRIGYKEESSEEWQYQDFSVSGSDKWKEFTAFLPQDIASQLHIVGVAAPQSILAIDNIKIEQEINNSDTRAAHNTHVPLVPNNIFSITGMKRQQPKRGINIVRTANGKAIKVISK